MKYAVLALALCAVAYAASDAGGFVPRSVFTLDSEGHQSNVQPVNDRLLRRLRRQTFSSSSSSSSSGDGVYHSTSSQTFQNNDGATYTSGNVQHIVQPQVDLAQRFGDDSPSSFGAQSSQSPQGVSISYTSVQDPQGNAKVQATQANLSNGQWKVNQTNFAYPKN